MGAQKGWARGTADPALKLEHITLHFVSLIILVLFTSITAVAIDFSNFSLPVVGLNPRPHNYIPMVAGSSWEVLV